MELIADGLLIAGAMTAALYCWVLSRRLNALKSMDKGLGGAIAGLSARVEQTRSSLSDTKAAARDLAALTARAEAAARRMELLLAATQEDEAPARSAAGGRPARAEAEGGSGPQRLRAAEPAVQSEPAAAEVTGLVPQRSAEAPPAPRRENDLVTALRRIAAGAGR